MFVGLASRLLFTIAVVFGDASYNEPFRPAFHFSQPEQWMNDPNGLVYYEVSITIPNNF